MARRAEETTRTASGTVPKRAATAPAAEAGEISVITVNRTAPSGVTVALAR
jgi:hypothetical protein